MRSMSDVRTAYLRRGGTLAYSEFGDPSGTPVLYLHGTPGSRLDGVVLDDAAKASSIRLICPDRPGYGDSDTAPTYDLRAFPPVIRDLLDDLKVDGLSVLSLSGGTPFAVATTAALGERVKSAAFVSGMGTGGFGVPAANIFAIKLAHRFRPGLRAYLAHTRFWEGRDHEKSKASLQAKRALPDQELVDGLDIGHALWQSRREGLKRTVEGVVTDCHVFAQDWRFDLGKVSARTHIWHGDADTTVDISCSEALHARLPGSTFTVLPGTGHLWLFGNAGQVFARLRED